MTKPKFEIRDFMSLDHKSVRQDAMDLLQDVRDSNKKPFLRASIDATHAGRLTNMRVYPGKKMQRSADSFLKPTPKPVLKHHRDDQDAIGRVRTAEFVQLKHGEAFDFDYRNPSKGAGSGFVRLGVDIMDPDAIEQFMDGRISQFSTRQHFQDVYCSVCGENIADQMAMGGMFNTHEHQVGETYRIGKGKDASDYLCFLITGDLDYKEVSAVNIPGDDETKINGFEIVEPQVAADWAVMKCGGDTADHASVDSLTLSVGTDFVDLLAGGSVTASDREKLTGKTIVAVSSIFNDQLEDQNTMDKENTPDPELEEPQGKDSQNTESSEAREDSADSSNAKDGKETTEGVTAPESTASDESSTSDQTSTLTSAALTASLEALTEKLEKANAKEQELQGKVGRLEAQLAEKDEEVERQKAAAADALAEAKESYAQQLLSNRLILKKADTQGIDSKEAYDSKLLEYTERSLDSLKDAISDLGPEVAASAKALGVKTAKDFAADKPVDNPVNNTSSKSADSESKQPRTPKEELTNWVNS